MPGPESTSPQRTARHVVLPGLVLVVAVVGAAFSWSAAREQEQAARAVEARTALKFASRGRIRDLCASALTQRPGMEAARVSGTAVWREPHWQLEGVAALPQRDQPFACVVAGRTVAEADPAIELR